MLELFWSGSPRVVLVVAILVDQLEEQRNEYCRRLVSVRIQERGQKEDLPFECVQTCCGVGDATIDAVAQVDLRSH